MKVIGLTGSVAMGKSATAQLFRDCGAWVFDADQIVHNLYAPGGQAVGLIAALYPDAIQDGAVNRPVLSRHILGNTEALTHIEQMIHPLLDMERHKVLYQASRLGHPYVILDIPLLFETELYRICDAICVVTAPAWLQRHRALSRPGMSPEKLSSVLQRQVPDTVKRQLATHLILTASGFAATRSRVRQLDRLFRRPGMRARHHMRPCWQVGGLCKASIRWQDQLFLRRVRHA